MEREEAGPDREPHERPMTPYVSAAAAASVRSRSDSLAGNVRSIDEDEDTLSPVRSTRDVESIDDESADPWWDDGVVPQSSGFRTAVLRFLAPSDKLCCALGNAAWYDAAKEWDSWQPSFARTDFLALCLPPATRGEVHRHYAQDPDTFFIPTTSPALLLDIPSLSAAEVKDIYEVGGHITSWPGVVTKGVDCSVDEVPLDADATKKFFRRKTFGAPMQFDSPLMYSYVMYAELLSIMHIRLMLPTVESPFRSMIGGFAALFGRNDLRSEEQYPVAHMLLRHPTFLSLTELWVLSPGYGCLPPYLAVMAHVTRWFIAQPAFSDIPWLISFGRWVATARDPNRGGKPMAFHKLLIAPLLALASGTKYRLNRIHQYWGVVDATIAIIHRYLDEAISVDAAERRRRKELIQQAIDERSTPPPPPSEDVFILPDTDPRLCFSVLQHLRLSYGKLRPALEAKVREELGEYGIDQLVAAERRMTVIYAARRVHEEAL